MKKFLKWPALGVFVFAASWLMFHLLRDGFIPLASFIGAAVVFVVLVFLRKKLAPWRWLVTGVVLAGLFTVYPIVYTVYLSFTNMSGGHLLTQSQAVQRIAAERYAPEDDPSYAWTAFGKGSSDFMLWLSAPDGHSMTVRPGQAPVDRGQSPVPESIDGYARLDKVQTIQSMDALGSLEFGEAPVLVSIQSLDLATATKSRYLYDSKADRFTDALDQRVYTPVRGTYTSADGKVLVPGFMVNVGVDNYSRFLGNDGYRKPMLAIILWNVVFSLASVLLSFGVGLVIALVFENLPGQRIIRSLLIVPYPIPVLVSIMVWRGLLNEKMGMVTNILQSLGIDARFFTDANWSRLALIIINVYLSYPYFYILATGALKSIPRDLFEAAHIDGAGAFATLRTITLPMVLRILGPLLIASFSFNFNNFTLIWGFNAGLPAMADTIVPMGYTDLLISFIYRLGFNTANAADYGFSAAITVMLFFLVAIMVFFQTMRSKAMKEV